MPPADAEVIPDQLCPPSVQLETAARDIDEGARGGVRASG